MQPSGEQIVESVRHGLATQIAPVLDDAVAQSVLRSIDGLLAHLAVRMEHEAAFLVDDNARARDVLGLEPVDEPVLTIGELTRRNDELREQIDSALVAATDARDREVIGRIDRYLAARLAAEAPFFTPAFAKGTY
jgi:hypothetical protein